MKYIIKEGSKESVEHVLNTVDIYHITKLPWQVCLQDVDRKLGKRDNKTIRFEWMWGRDGFFQSLHNYSNYFKRIVELALVGDKCFSLRQRMNIVNELLRCNFDTNLPVHISMAPKKSFKEKNKTIKLNNTQDLENFDFVIHPGHTRAEGSVFTKMPLRNVLLYVNKEHKDTYNILNNPHVKKIESIEQLLPVYRPNKEALLRYEDEFNENKKEIIIDFHIPGHNNNKGLKKHSSNQTSILKCNRLFINNPDRPSVQSHKTELHSSHDYLSKSYLTTSSFSSIFLNNRLNIYTTDIKKTRILLEKGEYSLEQLVDGIQHLNHPAKTLNIQNTFGNEIDHLLLTRFNPMLHDLDAEELKMFFKFSDFLRSNRDWYHASNLKDPLQRYENHAFKIFYNETNKTFNHNFNVFKDLVERNNYKGFCVYIHPKNIGDFERSIFELMFCINSSVALTTNSERTIVVINCEHTYWKTETNLKKWELANAFFTDKLI